MNRELLFEADLTCDLCGADGAYDVFGDQICPTCMGMVPANTTEVRCEDLIRLLAGLTEHTCSLDSRRALHAYVPAVEEVFKVLVQAGYLEHETWDIYRWTEKRLAERAGA